jgi:hypothetical protein
VLLLLGAQNRFFFVAGGYPHSDLNANLVGLFLPAGGGAPQVSAVTKEGNVFVSKFGVTAVRETLGGAAVAWGSFDRDKMLNALKVALFERDVWARPVVVSQRKGVPASLDTTELLSLSGNLWLLTRLDVGGPGSPGTFGCVSITEEGAAPPIPLAEDCRYAAFNAQGSDEVGGTFKKTGGGLVYAWLDSGKPRQVLLGDVRGSPECSFVRKRVLYLIAGDEGWVSRCYSVQLPPSV